MKNTNLKNILKDSDLSIKKIAQLVNVTPTSIHNWKQQRYVITNVDHLFKLAQILGTNVYYLVGLTKFKKPYSNIKRID